MYTLWVVKLVASAIHSSSARGQWLPIRDKTEETQNRVSGRKLYSTNHVTRRSQDRIPLWTFSSKRSKSKTITSSSSHKNFPHWRKDRGGEEWEKRLKWWTKNSWIERILSIVLPFPRSGTQQSVCYIASVVLCVPLTWLGYVRLIWCLNFTFLRRKYPCWPPPPPSMSNHVKISNLFFKQNKYTFIL